MTGEHVENLVAVAFAHDAKVQAWRVAMSREEGERTDRILRHLLDLGHIVGFSIQTVPTDAMPMFVEQLRSGIGNVLFDACSETLHAPTGPPPAFLVPVWPFDHEIEGLPAATGCLLGLDLELIAKRSSDEELGAHLPGRDGRWLIHARPLF